MTATGITLPGSGFSLIPVNSIVAPSFTAPVTLTGLANTSVITETGYSLTGTNNQSMESWAGTLNTSGVVDVVKYSITDTAHGAGSTFVNYYGGVAGATSMFSVSLSGAVVQAGNLQLTSAGPDMGILPGFTAGTIGLLAGSTLTYAAANGSYANFRGNTYVTNANQRGNIYLSAGNPSSPATPEGTINFLTGADVFRMTIGNAGSIIIPTGTFQFLGTTTGIADVMAVTSAPAIVALTPGCIYFVKANLANATTTPTININALGAKTLVKRVSTALAANDYLASMYLMLLYDGTNMVLLNPVVN